MNRLKELRIEKGISMMEVAKQLGMPYTTYVNYEKGIREPNSETLILLANYFHVSIDYLIGNVNDPLFHLDNRRILAEINSYEDSSETQYVSVVNLLPVPQLRKVPLLGAIACGEPILAAENIEDEVDMPSHISADFALRCKGDSMINARIFDGDIVYIRQQDIVDNNDIAAVLIGEEATLKRVRLFEDHIVLEPENPKYRPFVYWNEEMNDVRILGKAVAFTSTVR